MLHRPARTCWPAATVYYGPNYRMALKTGMTIRNNLR